MKKLPALLLCLAMLLTLAACGQETADPAEAKRLVIWHDKEDGVIAAMEQHLKTALPELEIIFEKKTSLTDSLKLVGNDPSAAPDLFLFAHDKVGVFAEMGILAPVTELLEQQTLEPYLDMTLTAATYNGTLYQLPLYFETLLFMYNRRYMQDEEVPKTTEELLTYMENNTGRGRYGFVEQHSTAYYSAAWIHGFGGSIIDDSATPFPDAQAVKSALEYHLKFVALMPGETEYSTVNTLFLEGKADATIGGPLDGALCPCSGDRSGHCAHARSGCHRSGAGTLFRGAGHPRAEARRRDKNRRRAAAAPGAYRSCGGY
ncbi:MAG: extracellular solute-binding protein [Oscillospiraceae bacterium]|nr:extracellular solute-binding protein [Oscillospiraceae bacterium]